MASEIFPMVVLENDRPEWAFLCGNKIASGRNTDGAVAAQFSHVGLHNPAGSGIMAVCEQITIDGLPQSELRFYRGSISTKPSTVGVAAAVSSIESLMRSPGEAMKVTGDVFRTLGITPAVPPT